MEEGLPHNSVRSLLQSHDGYLWLGTHAGLARFDGVRFVVFNTANSALLHNEIRSLAEAADGSLWIGTSAGGLHRFVDGVVEPFSGAQTNLTINALQLDANGQLWVGTASGLYVLSSAGTLLPGPGLLTTNYIIGIHLDDSRLWIATESGLFSVTDGQARAHPLPSSAGNYIGSITRARDGRIYIGAEKQVLVLEESDADLRLMETHTLEGSWGEIPALLEDRDGNIWIGSYGGGIYRLTDGTIENLNTEDGFIDHRPWSLAEDREGGLWLGTRGGVARMKDGAAITVSVAEGLPYPIARTVMEDTDGSIWIGVRGGLAQYRNGSIVRSFTPQTGLPIESVRTLLRDREGTFWAGGIGGIAAIDTVDGKILQHFTEQHGLPDRDVRNLLEDTQGRVWIGTERGVAVAPSGLAQSDIVVPDMLAALGDDAIEALYEDQAGHVLIGTRNRGMARVTHDGLVTPQLLPDASVGVRTFYQDEKGFLFVGSMGSGLFIQSAEGQSLISSERGLPDDAIWSILPVGDSLWMCSDRGIFSVRKSDLMGSASGEVSELPIQARIGTQQGMKNRECNGGGSPSGVVARSGRLWYPTAQGAVLVNPGYFEQPRMPPSVVIEELMLDRKPLPGGTSLTVPPEARDLEIVYTGLSFSDPGQVRFRYRLHGYERDWVSVGNRRRALYANLPAGDFVFEVQASVRGSPWEETGARLELTVMPHLYQRWTVQIAAVLLVVGFLSAWLHRRASLQRRREDELRTLVAKRTEELEKANTALQHLAATDALTSLANHRTFSEKLEQAWSRCKRAAEPLTLLICDIDDFKAFNDTYGHPAGDEALRKVANALQAAARRDEDTAARCGGEEFAVILVNTDAKGARNLAEELRKTVERLRLENRHARAAPVLTVSVGGVTVIPNNQASPSSLIQLADTALYEAKNKGRNCCVLDAPYMDDHS